MLRKLLGWTISKEESKWPNYEIALEEFKTGELFGIEEVLTRLRGAGILLYSIYLALSTTNPVYVSRTRYLLILGMFVLLHITSYLFEKFDPKYSEHTYRVLRFQFYLLLAGLLIFLGGGTDSHLLLFSPYLLFAGIYIGSIWSAIVTVEATLLTFEVYYYLGLWDFAGYSTAHISLRVLAILIVGGMATYLWTRQHYSRAILLRQETEFSRVAAHIASALDFDSVMKETVNFLKRLVKAENGLVITDEDNDGVYTVLFAWGYPDKPSFEFRPSERGDEGLTGWVLFSKQPLLIRDTEASEIVPKYPEISKDQILRSYLGVPLVVENDLIGVLLVMGSRPNQFNREHQVLLQRLGQWLAIGLRNAYTFGKLTARGDYFDRLSEERQQRVRQLSILQDCSIAIQGEPGLAEQLFYALIAITIKDSLAFNRGIIFLVDKYGGHICGECAIGPENEEDAKRIYEDELWKQPTACDLIVHLFQQNRHIYEGASLNRFVKTLRFPLRGSHKNILAETAAQSSTEPKIVVTANLPDDEFCEILKQQHLQAEEFALVPLVVQGKTIGVLYVDNRFNNKKIEPDDIGLLQIFASQLGAIIINTRIMEEREKVFYDVAHTIGTPVTTITGFSERLADRSFLNTKESQEYIEIIARNAEYLRTVTVQALYSTYLERMTAPLRLDWVPVDWLYTSLLGLNRFRLRERGNEIGYVSADKPIELCIERNLMLGALQCLVDNAIKFSGIHRCVWFRVNPIDDGSIAIEVKDEGIGIPPDELPRIWDSYFRGRQAEEMRIEGIGIGLQLAKRIVEAHQGNISVKSQPGIGSTFTVLLPKEKWRYQQDVGKRSN